MFFIKSLFQIKMPSSVAAQDNVQILADLNQPLKIVRSKLEKLFNVNLGSYSIWLQVIVTT